MRKTMQRSLSCLLTLAMVVTMLMTSTLAAEKSVKITLEYPKDVPANDVVVTMFKGIPAWYQKREAKTVEGIVKAFTEPNSENYPKLTIIEPDKDGKYTVTEATVISSAARSRASITASSSSSSSLRQT